jgi:hypothetical protein
VDAWQHVSLQTTVAGVLVGGGGATSGLFSGSNALEPLNVFAQEHNQTTTASGNNTNATTAAASTYNEMLNPRQKEYPAHLGFNDLHIEAIRHIDPNATQPIQQQQQKDVFNLIVHHHDSCMFAISYRHG